MNHLRPSSSSSFFSSSAGVVRDLIQPRLTAIWSERYFEGSCFDLWQAHFDWLTAEGVVTALHRDSPPVAPAGSTGHEMVDLLAQFIGQTGLVNAHLGLTSSDVCDNARLQQVAASLGWLDVGLTQLVLNLPHALLAGLPGGPTEPCLGFTHWQPAAPLTWGWRVLAWLAPLRLASRRRPVIHAKRFGGPVGDAASLQLVLGAVPVAEALDRFDTTYWHRLGDLAAPANLTPLQSSDHVDELAAVAWVAGIAAQLHKLAADWRFLASQGVVEMTAPAAAGSSSLPHKHNPHRWEKVCGLCRSAATVQQEMWDVAAHNSCERTLDTSWQIKHALPRMFLAVAEAIDLLGAHPPRVRSGRDLALLTEHSDEVNSDRELTRRVLRGEARWTAYLTALTRFAPSPPPPTAPASSSS